MSGVAIITVSLPPAANSIKHH